jgi:hypothetical protein
VHGDIADRDLVVARLQVEWDLLPDYGELFVLDSERWLRRILREKADTEGAAENEKTDEASDHGANPPELT